MQLKWWKTEPGSQAETPGRVTQEMGALSPHLATAQVKDQLGPGSSWGIRAPRTHPLVWSWAGLTLLVGLRAPVHASLASVPSAVKWER